MERNAELDRTSRTDALTGLYNRRHLDDELRRQGSTAQRHTEPLSLILFDIDHFKHVNDTYGHPTGDLVLQEFARRLTHELRAADIAGRWGGEEFLLILPRTHLAGAIEVAERIRMATAAHPISAAGHEVCVTVSAECAVGPAEPDELVKIVDTALYEAKATGRNRTVASTPPAAAQE